MNEEHLKYVSTMDKQVFREIMLAYGQDVWNYAYFLTKRQDFADDISQDVFLSLYRMIGTYCGQSSLKTWLFAITRNIAFNYRRSAFFRKVIPVGWIKDTKGRTARFKPASIPFDSSKIIKGYGT